ncbi:MAG: TetR/AcrR family transcriptional regulator [Clostridiales bacterium]|nr:TetR/AcrR family transcriptional regulator [Clostridiales bacterium]
MARISKPPEERRQELIETANELFLTQGYEQTTVGDIVRKVGVAQGLFYYYFRSKQDIFLTVVDQFLEARIGEMAVFLRDAQTPPLKRVRNLLQGLSHFLRETEALFPRNRASMAEEMYMIMYNHVSEQIEPMVTQLLQDAAGQGLLSAPFPDRLARFIISGFIGVESMPDRPKADEMMELIMFALERLLHVSKQALDVDE